MKPKRCPSALALALLALAPALPAQEAPEAEALQGVWIFSGVLDPDGLPWPPETYEGFSASITFKGSRYTRRYMEDGEIVGGETGIFEAAGGILRLTPDDGGEPEDIPYTLEDGAQTLYCMENEKISITMVYRRKSVVLRRLDTGPRGRYDAIMIFPLEQLIGYEDNMYEITCAASRRAYQLSMLQDPEVDDNEGKVVPLAAQQVFTKEIEFRIEESA